MFVRVCVYVCACVCVNVCLGGKLSSHQGSNREVSDRWCQLTNQLEDRGRKEQTQPNDFRIAPL